MRVLADQVGDAGVVDHHLDRRDPAAVDLRQEPLADTPRRTPARIERICCCLAGEELDHPADRLGGVDGVHRREHEVARLGRLERGLRGLRVAELADEDHVGVLAERAPERLLERLGVEPDLALVDDAAVVGVEDLDRVLDRDDVLLPRPVDVADHRGERRRLPRAGRAGDEDEAAVLLGEPRDAGRQARAGRRSARARDHAEGERDRAALAEGVDAEARQLVGGYATSRSPVLWNCCSFAGDTAQTRSSATSRSLSESAGHSGISPSVPSRRMIGGRLQLEVDVGRAELDGAREEER